jgi:hypothetical protein
VYESEVDRHDLAKREGARFAVQFVVRDASGGVRKHGNVTQVPGVPEPPRKGPARVFAKLRFAR